MCTGNIKHHHSASIKKNIDPYEQEGTLHACMHAQTVKIQVNTG